jgi:nitric oxide reductase subunit B
MRRLWIALAAVCTVEFAILGWIGLRIWREMPPIPDRVVTDDGIEVVASGDVLRGQQVWQTLGGMDVGSIWGHGGYVAPDWTADWLHREALFILDEWARTEHGRGVDELSPETQAALRARLVGLMRSNRYGAGTRTLVIEPVRARAFEENARHYAAVFRDGSPEYAIPKGALSDPERLHRLAAFFFWTSWAATARRPGDTVSYTSNWPHEPLVDNRPTGDAIVWTGVSVLVLLAGIGAFVWYYAGFPVEEAPERVPISDPLVGWRATPSQRATLKYFVVVAALFLLQILTGVLTAHYAVEGDGLYGFPLSRWLPYSVTRTWHLQLGLFWIATSWLASGLFIAPLASGHEPRGQRLGVNVLFGALVLVVGGSLAGQWASIQGHLDGAAAFYFGHQGWEYLELGRVWQAALFVGLLLWLVLILRALGPALRQLGDARPLVSIFALAAGAIALFYGAGLLYGRESHISIVEYWRWWVVHLWVEGFFEVFATTVIAFLFARLGLLRATLAARASLAAAAIYLAGGIVGTAHHLYFAGTPTAVLALGATFSALEVVPLVLIGRSAMKDLRTSRAAPWARAYRWPVYFFVAVAFWNLVGAGLFGFMINPPIALYYMQGLNTTPVHGHGALFGVYGMLGLGLMLMCLRALRADLPWREGLLRFAFWGMNLGLAGQIGLSLLPLGLIQTWYSVQESYWLARSPELLTHPVLQALKWLRVPGDTLFAAGAIAIVLFVFGLRLGWSVEGGGTRVRSHAGG